jgi:hypothetical protein
MDVSEGVRNKVHFPSAGLGRVFNVHVIYQYCMIHIYTFISLVRGMTESVYSLPDSNEKITLSHRQTVTII